MFKTLYGVNLPRHTNYSPLVVKPQEARGSEIVDPETGNSIDRVGFSPPSLRNRSPVAVAEPDFRDAIQTYIA